VLTATIEEVDKPLAEAIVAHLSKLSGDASLTLREIRQGSVKLILEGSQDGLDRLASLIREGKLSEILGIPIQEIQSETFDSRPISRSRREAQSGILMKEHSNYLVDTVSPQQKQQSILLLSSKQPLREMLVEALQTQVSGSVDRIQSVAQRIEIEINRICAKSDRIQKSGISESWRVGLARHRVSKCLYYYQLGSRQGRIELHSHLSSIVYRYITVPQSQLGFEARYSLIEDFLQEFYIESLKVFRRENELGDTYTPRSLLELAEYMVFTECYGKRRIHLRFGSSQQLIVLRAQIFAKRQPNETSLDIE
jgi:hypothetical protein